MFRYWLSWIYVYIWHILFYWILSTYMTWCFQEGGAQNLLHTNQRPPTTFTVRTVHNGNNGLPNRCARLPAISAMWNFSFRLLLMHRSWNYSRAHNSQLSNSQISLISLNFFSNHIKLSSSDTNFIGLLYYGSTWTHGTFSGHLKIHVWMNHIGCDCMIDWLICIYLLLPRHYVMAV